MRQLMLAAVAVLATSIVASAQSTITATNYVVGAGGSVDITVQGTPGESFALLSSSTNSGFSFAGVNLAVGLDVQLVQLGVIPGGGTVVVPFTPPFPARDRIYLQAATSPSPAFAPLSVSNSVVLANAQDARLNMPVGGIVTANGTLTFGTPGVTVTHPSPGVYVINHNGFMPIPAVIPSITPIGAGIFLTSLGSGANFTTVTLNTDAQFWFTIQVVRR